MARKTALTVYALPGRRHTFQPKVEAVIINVQATRRVFYVDNARRVLVKDTTRRIFEKDTTRRTFTTR